MRHVLTVPIAIYLVKFNLFISVSAAGDATADGDTNNGSGNGASSSVAYRYPPKVSLKLNFDTSATSGVESSFSNVNFRSNGPNNFTI